MKYRGGKPPNDKKGGDHWNAMKFGVIKKEQEGRSTLREGQSKEGLSTAAI